MKTIRNIVIIMTMMSDGLKMQGGKWVRGRALGHQRLVALTLVMLVHLAPFLALQLYPDLMADLWDQEEGRGRAGAPPLMLMQAPPAPAPPKAELQPVQISAPQSVPNISPRLLVMPAIPMAKPVLVAASQPSATVSAPADAVPAPAITGLSGSQQQRDQHEQSSAADKGGGGAVADAYLAELLAWINRQKRYPDEAAARRITGDVVLLLVVDRWGRLRTLSLHRSSGERSLDLAALAQVKRASPLPRPTDPDWETRRFEITVRFELAELEP